MVVKTEHDESDDIAAIPAIPAIPAIAGPSGTTILIVGDRGGKGRKGNGMAGNGMAGNGVPGVPVHMQQLHGSKRPFNQDAQDAHTATLDAEIFAAGHFPHISKVARVKS